MNGSSKISKIKAATKLFIVHSFGGGLCRWPVSDVCRFTFDECATVALHRLHKIRMKISFLFKV
uniref:Uncharacterized protein n=1 Tax=Onchocerca volvulus TaxID=6282 RepID=A0A2K6W6L5_ONCVO